MPADLYPSRIDTEPRWLERMDPVLYRTDMENAPISAKQLADFERDGYLVLPEVFTPEEVAVFKKELQRISTLPEVLGSPAAIREPDSGALRSLFAIHRTKSCLLGSQGMSALPVSSATSWAVTCTCTSRV